MAGRKFSSGKVEVIACRGCGKRTTSGIDGTNVDLCRECYDDANAEVMHSDKGHDEAVAAGYPWPTGCPECEGREI